MSEIMVSRSRLPVLFLNTILIIAVLSIRDRFGNSWVAPVFTVCATFTAVSLWSNWRYKDFAPAFFFFALAIGSQESYWAVVKLHKGFASVPPNLTIRARNAVKFMVLPNCEAKVTIGKRTMRAFDVSPPMFGLGGESSYPKARSPTSMRQVAYRPTASEPKVASSKTAGNLDKPCLGSLPLICD